MKQPARVESPVTLEKWRKGDALEADKLDQPRRYLAEQEAIANSGEQIRPLISDINALPLIIQRFVVSSVAGDYVVCTRDDASGTVNVAKPYQLRNSITSRNGVTYTYTTTQERDGTDGSNDETQVVTPSYVAGDVIFAVGPVVGGTSVTDALKWVDMNVDGRAWAVKSE